MFSGRFFLLSPCQPRDFPAGNISRYNPACPQPVIPRHASRPENDKTSRPDTPVSYSRPPVVFSRVDPSHPVRTMPANPHNGHPTITQGTVIRLHTVSACVSTISPPSPCIFASPHSITNIPVPVPETDDPADNGTIFQRTSHRYRKRSGNIPEPRSPRCFPVSPLSGRPNDGTPGHAVTSPHAGQFARHPAPNRAQHDSCPAPFCYPYATANGQVPSACAPFTAYP